MIIKELRIELTKLSCALRVANFTRSSQLVANSWRLACLNLFFVCFLSCGELEQKGSAAYTAIGIPEKEVLKDKLTLHANEGLFYYLEQPFSGYSTAYYPNGEVAEKIGYWKGKKEGQYQKWYPDGTLSFDAFYQKGRKDGISKTWWKTGVLRSESIHKMGVTHGNQKQWYKSGQLFKSINIANGKEEGIQQAWRENGKIYNNYEAKNAAILGLGKKGAKSVN